MNRYQINKQLLQSLSFLDFFNLLSEHFLFNLFQNVPFMDQECSVFMIVLGVLCFGLCDAVLLI